MAAAVLIDVVTCAGQLVLAAIAFARASRTPVARPLGTFALAVAAWAAAGIGSRVAPAAAWALVDHALSPLFAPLALDIALTFDGRRRALRVLLVTAYALNGALGAASIAAFASADLNAFTTSRAWNVWLLCLAIPTMAVAILSLVAHLQRAVDRIEEERTRLVLAAFATATVLGATDILTPLAPFHETTGARAGLLIATTTMALVSLRFAWFDEPNRVRRATYASAAAGVALLVYVAMYGFADAAARGLILGSLAVTIALVAASRRWAIDAALQKERVAQLARLGRFSAQMAHDLKNPLAAVKGAAQLLREDVANLPRTSSGGPSPPELVDLVVEEVDRLARLVDTYGRLARIDLARAPTDVNDIVRDVVALHEVARRTSVKLKADLGPELPRCDADRDMLTSVLENLVRNAVEALPVAGGTIAVRTLRAPAGQTGVVVVVEDDGAGMDAKTRERAFDDFFTTKPTGSGLGLAFVKRVVEAHGGDVSLTSAPGRGTVVRLRLPS